MAEINKISVPFVPLGGTNVQRPAGPVVPQTTPFQSFDQVLSAELSEVKFSAHALQRLESRNLSVSPEVIQRLNKAVELAQQKGARESLVMVNSIAFIVNIPNKTVVTAVPQDANQVFTNIDFAVFA